MIRLFRKVKLAVQGRAGKIPQPEKWLFVVGCYNSGTTLLSNILSQHSEIGSLPSEGQFITDQLPIPKKLGFPRLWALKPELFYLDEKGDPKINVNVIKRQWAKHYNYPDRPVLLEKSVPNSARIKWLNHNFNNSYFVAIIRDGFAVAEGIHRKTGHAIREAALQWIKSNEIMLRDLEFVQHKKIIKYENFTGNPQKTIEDICEFMNIKKMNINFEEKTWQIHDIDSAIKNMNYKSYKALSLKDIEEIDSNAHSMLIQFDYNIPNTNCDSQ
jgi:hypothetical protein